MSTAVSTLNDGLIGHWTFDGPDVDWSSGTAEIKDISSSANDANAGGMSVASAGRGVVGQAIDFDGVDDYAEIGTQSIYNVAPGEAKTFSAWFKRDGLPSSTETILWNEGSCLGWYSAITTSGRILQSFITGASGCTGQVTKQITSSVSIDYADGGWHNLVVIIDRPGTTMTLYMDGLFSASTSVDNSLPAPNGTFRIGSIWNLSTFYRGGIDDVRVYNRALSAEEISQLYAMGEGVKVAKTVAPPSSSLDSGLLGHWTFDGPDVDWSSTTAEVRDSSGSGNSGDARNGMSTASAVPGAVGQALRFNSASGNYLQYGNILNSLAFPFSISSWVYRDGSTSDYIVATDDQDVPAGILCGAWIAIGSNQAQANTGDCVCNALNCKKTATTVSTVPTKEWVNIVAVFNSLGDSDIYFNGALQSVTYTGTATAFNQSSLSFKIGRSGRSPTADMDGMIDDVRIYNRALSATEIQQLYSMGR